MKLPKTHKMYTHHLEETVGLSYLQFLKDPLKKKVVLKCHFQQ